VKYTTRSRWRTAAVGSLGDAQADLDRWEAAVLDAFTTARPCRVKQNRPPGGGALKGRGHLARRSASGRGRQRGALRPARAGRTMSANDGVYQQLRGHMAQSEAHRQRRGARRPPRHHAEDEPQLHPVPQRAGRHRGQGQRAEGPTDAPAARRVPLPEDRIEEFDFDAQPTLDRRLIEELATTRFVAEKANLLFIGPPGVGTTTLALALMLKAVHADYRVYYTTGAHLIDKTAKAAPQGCPSHPVPTGHSIRRRRSACRESRRPVWVERRRMSSALSSEPQASAKCAGARGARRALNDELDRHLSRRDAQRERAQLPAPLSVVCWGAGVSRSAACEARRRRGISEPLRRRPGPVGG
jgi:hypothetical protein